MEPTARYWLTLERCGESHGTRTDCCTRWLWNSSWSKYAFWHNREPMLIIWRLSSPPGFPCCSETQESGLTPTPSFLSVGSVTTKAFLRTERLLCPSRRGPEIVSDNSEYGPQIWDVRWLSRFALRELRLILATLVRRYELSLIPGQSHELRVHTVPWFKQGFYNVGLKRRSWMLYDHFESVTFFTHFLEFRWL